jgi:hypothetical protein
MRFPPMVPQLEEALIPRGTKSSNPASSSDESDGLMRGPTGGARREHLDLADAGRLQNGLREISSSCGIPKSQEERSGPLTR